MDKVRGGHLRNIQETRYGNGDGAGEGTGFSHSFQA